MRRDDFTSTEDGARAFEEGEAWDDYEPEMTSREAEAETYEDPWDVI